MVKLQQNSLCRLATVGTPEEGEEQRSTWHGVFMELKLQESAHCVLHCGLSRAWNTACPEQIRSGGKGLSLETRLEGEGTGLEKESENPEGNKIRFNCLFERCGKGCATRRDP